MNCDLHLPKFLQASFHHSNFFYFPPHLIHKSSHLSTKWQYESCNLKTEDQFLFLHEGREKKDNGHQNLIERTFSFYTLFWVAIGYVGHFQTIQWSVVLEFIVWLVYCLDWDCILLCLSLLCIKYQIIWEVCFDSSFWRLENPRYGNHI
jgi:hypothetical protein